MLAQNKKILGSLRCSAELAGRELAALRQAHPETPAHPVLLSKPERDWVNQSQVRHCRSDARKSITYVELSLLQDCQR